MAIESALDVTLSVATSSGGTFNDILTVTSASKSDARTAVTQAYLGQEFALSNTLERQVSFDLTIHADPTDTGLSALRTAFETRAIVFIKRSTESDIEYPVLVATYNESASAGSMVEVSCQLLLAAEPVEDN